MSWFGIQEGEKKRTFIETAQGEIELFSNNDGIFKIRKVELSGEIDTVELYLSIAIRPGAIARKVFYDVAIGEWFTYGSLESVLLKIDNIRAIEWYSHGVFCMEKVVRSTTECFIIPLTIILTTKEIQRHDSKICAEELWSVGS